MADKKVVIILPFVSLNEYVKECAANCLRLDYDNFELILLPDESFCLDGIFASERVRVITTGDVTIAQKRNIAMRNCADAEYYALIDSDAYPRKDWLKNALKALSRCDQIWAVGGPNITPEGEPLYQKVVGNALKSFLVSGIGVFCKDISENRYCLKLPSCNLVVKKEAISLCKGFEESVEVGEDQLLCNQIIKYGKKIFFDNSVVVYHHNRFLGRHFLSQRIIYGYATIGVIKKGNSLFNIYFLSPVFLPLVLISGITFGFFNQIVLLISLIFIAFFLMIVLFDSIRSSGRIIEIPLTSIAILMGNFGFSAGLILSILGVKISIKKIYRNYREGAMSVCG